MFISIVLAVFLTGVTEPLEFMFMFCAIPLYIVYAILQGCAFALAGIFHLRLHSFGNLEFLMRTPMSIQAGLGGDIINFIIACIVFFGIGYFVAYWMIGKFSYATPAATATTPQTMTIRARLLRVLRRRPSPKAASRSRSESLRCWAAATTSFSSMPA